MESTPHVLVVDDHRDIRDPPATYLDRNGYRVSKAASGREARKVLKASAVDLVVLDIMMPGEDGLSLCRHLRETGEIPVILLTALGEDTERIVGLEMGADDYVTKPFNPRELLACVKAVIRRSQSLPPRQKPPTGKRVRFDRWILDLAQREVIDPEGVSIPLSTGEFRLLSAFVERPRMVLTRDQLLDLTQGRDADVFDRSIDNQVSRLRRKIETDPKNPKVIKTIWGGGYSLSVEVEPL